MTGSDMGGLLVGLGTVMSVLFGMLFLIAGLIVLAVSSFQWWIFAIAGAWLLFGGIGWHMLRGAEKRYYAHHGNTQILNLK